jgi:ATP-dependent Clp protease ATP-binding subunit ClpC
MSEYMEKHSVAKLIGSPPGYIGFEEGGQLTERVRRNPYTVVLLDEIEKAHPDVSNILLQILEDGRLTDAQGRTVSFKNTIIIATSNIGTQAIQNYYARSNVKKPSSKLIKFQTEHYGDADLEKLVHEELKKFFRIELINRFDEVIVFDPLSKEQLRNIAKLQVETLTQRLHNQEIDLSIDEKALDLIVEHSYSPEYGARELRRFVQRFVENKISKLILSNEDIRHIKISSDGQELLFRINAK